MNFNLGWYQKQDKKENAEEIIDSIKLLTYRQLKNLFPDSVIIREKFLIFTKSFLISLKSSAGFGPGTITLPMCTNN
jgi:hypothetical protein